MRAIDGLHLSLKLSGSLTDNKEAWEDGLGGMEGGRKCDVASLAAVVVAAMQEDELTFSKKTSPSLNRSRPPALPPARHADEDDGGGNLNTLSRFNASGRSHTSNNAWAGAGAGGNLNSDPRQSGILVQRSPIAWHRIVYRGSIVPHSDPVILCVIFKLPGRCECTPRRIQKDISENARGHAARARGGSSASSSGATAQLPPYSIFLIVFSSL